MTSDELRKRQVRELLVCDTCGRICIDDDAADSESCECGRFKQRMEWATVNDVLERIDLLMKRVDEASGILKNTLQVNELDGFIGLAVKESIEDFLKRLEVSE
jgi:hypothetical protein